MLNDLAENFRKYYELGFQVDVDEMCIPFKGRHFARCYNPNKPNKWHFKSYCLNDTKTGYLWDFFMYRGWREQLPQGVTATTYPVKRLLEAIHDARKRVLATDNWYTSIALMKMLREHHPYIDFVGTVKVNSKGLPKSKLFAKTGRRKMPRGTIECYKIIFEGNNYYLTCWMDNKPVHILSTTKPQFTLVNRKSKVEGNGRYVEIRIPRPTIIELYNLSMGGTDKFDQFGSY